MFDLDKVISEEVGECGVDNIICGWECLGN